MFGRYVSYRTEGFPAPVQLAIRGVGASARASAPRYDLTDGHQHLKREGLCET
jgi:hypothetical protein